MDRGIERILLVRLSADLINQSGHPRAIRPPFTLKYIQSLAGSRGYSVELIDHAVNWLALREMINFLIRWQPDIVIISLTSLELDSIQEFINLLKFNCRDIIAVLTGQGADEKVLDYCPDIDFVIKGEPEVEIPNLIDKINKNENIENLKKHYRKELLNDYFIVEKLDDLPFPLYNRNELASYSFVYPLKIYKRLRWGHILSSRGCPNSCIFCSQVTRESYGRQIRLRSPQNIVNEIESLVSVGANIVSFDDDNFAAIEGHVRGVCAELLKREIKIKWICHARVDNLSEDLLILMKKAGCILLRCGVESGAERIIGILHKGESSCWSKKTRQVFLSARKIGIATNALFLIGNPSETVEEIEKTISLAKSLSPDVIQVAFFTPYPGSAIYEEYKNILFSVPLCRMYHYSAPLVNFSRVELRDLVRFQKLFYKKFLLNPGFIAKHILDYGIFYLFNLDVLSKLLRGAIRRVKVN